jgi:hypothetical protein
MAMMSDKKRNEIADKIKVRSAEAQVRKYVPAQLSFWSEDHRAFANEIARSALFQCGDNRKPRKFFDNAPLFMLGEGTLTYKGEELRSRDEDVFEALAHRARDLPSGKMIVRLSSSDICKMNNWRQAQSYYNEIYLSIQRMKAGVITVFSRRLAKAIKCQRAIDAGEEDSSMLPIGKKEGEIGGMMLSLVGGEPTFVGGTSLKDEIPQGNLSWEITLDKKLVSLFARPYLTLVHINARQALKPIGKRLQAYFLSHKKPYPVKLRSLEKMLGIQFTDLFALKYALTTHFEDLKNNGVIANFEYTKSADNSDWLVLVTRHQSTQND